jgi:glycosyltransferase involved in cell wall biosynthesis
MNLLMLSGDSTVAQGYEGTFSQMLSRFCKHWDRIDILCSRAPGASARTIYGNVYIHPSPWHKILQPWFILRQGRALIAERKYALITSHDFGLFYNGTGARWLSRRSGIPYVSEILHVEGYPRAATTRERIYRLAAEYYIRAVRGSAAGFRVMNRVEMPEFLRRLGVPEEKILVLPAIYMDFDIFHPVPEETRRFEVLFVGRLAANKGLFTILDALALARRTYPSIQLCILGRGPLRGALEKRITTLKLEDAVTLIERLPRPEDVARLYNQSAMLVCASTAEGGPRVAVEAMACGTPVISTPVGVMRELIIDGQNGLLFNWDARELADKICTLLANEALRRQIAEAGHQSVQGFDADSVIAAYARGYQDLVHRLREQA